MLNLIDLVQCKGYLRLKISVQGPFNHSQPVSSGRVALHPVVTDTRTTGEATLRR